MFHEFGPFRANFPHTVCLTPKTTHVDLGLTESEGIGEKCKKLNFFDFNFPPFPKFNVNQGLPYFCSADCTKVGLRNL